MSKSFMVEIRIANDLMQTTEDVAGALTAVAQRLRRDGDQPIDPDFSTRIFDLNGQSVGEAVVLTEDD